MHIKGLQKLTLLDYKGYLAATIFTGGCNFTCPFCHNSDLVLYPNTIPSIPENTIFEFLKNRIGRLEAVCVTGGEPTLQKDLPTFLANVKHLGYKVKLDTNGTSPDTIDYLVQNHLIDYIAIDVKNAKHKYAETAGFTCNINCNTNDNFINKIEQSIQYILHCGCPYEFRTTLVKELHTQEDILSICKWIEGADAYYLQPYRNSPEVIQPIYSRHSDEELQHFQKIAQQYVKSCAIIGT